MSPRNGDVTPTGPSILISTVLTGGGLNAAQSVTPLAVTLNPNFATKRSISIIIRAGHNRQLKHVVQRNDTVPSANVPKVVNNCKGRHIVRTNATNVFVSLHRVKSVIRTNRAVTRVHATSNTVVSIAARVANVLHKLLHDDCPMAPNFGITSVSPHGRRLSGYFLVSSGTHYVTNDILRLIYTRL